MDLGAELGLVLGGGAIILSLFFQNQPFQVQLEGVLGLAILLLWVGLNDTRKNYQRKRGNENAD